MYHDSSSLQTAFVTGGEDQYGERWGAMAIGLWRISRPSGDALCWRDGVTMGLPPHTPLGDFIPKPHLRFAAVKSSFYAPAVRQVTLRSLTAFSVSLRVGRRLGCRPNLPEGILPSDSHLRFALTARFFMIHKGVHHACFLCSSKHRRPCRRYRDADRSTRRCRHLNLLPENRLTPL